MIFDDTANKIIENSFKNQKYDANGLLIETHKNSKILVISCSGIVPEKIIYAMENSTVEIETNKIFICDPASLWYYAGIPGLTNDFQSTVGLIREIARKLAPERICTVGTSGGGYMALALGHFIEADRVLAMAPQTSLGREWRAQHNDTRWSENIEQIQKLTSESGPLDISNLLQTNRAGTAYHVIHARGDALDTQHAMRIADHDGVHVYGLDCDDHNVSAQLHKRHRLQELLNRFITLERDDLPRAITDLTR